MFVCILIAVTIFVAKESMAISTERCQMVISGTCIQHCLNQSCDCGVTDSNHGYSECYQASAGYECREIKCSTETCYQKCHNCHMECTSDVSFCKQRCLSGACSFTCNAQHCEQECVGENCQNTTFDNCQLILPLNYLVLLAGILFVISMLACVLLVMSFKKKDCIPDRFRKPPPYSKI